MNRLLLLSALLTGGTAAAWGSTPVMVQDFEKASSLPNVWVVNIPNENARVKLTHDHPYDGKQCLALHYHFTGTGSFQYIGVPNKVKIQAPIHKLHFRLYGDNSLCSYGVQVSDASGETHQYSRNTHQGGLVDFSGWREVVVDMDSGHETWGHDHPWGSEAVGRMDNHETNRRSACQNPIISSHAQRGRLRQHLQAELGVAPNTARG